MQLKARIIIQTVRRVMATNSSSALPGCLRVRMVLGSIGKELALTVCKNVWAKPAISELAVVPIKAHE